MFRWLANRIPKPVSPPAIPPPPARAQTEDWAVGDLSECIAYHPWVHHQLGLVAGPLLGELNIVESVVENHFGHVGLSFRRWPGHLWAAHWFRKIILRADLAERADAAFIADLTPQFAPQPEHA